MKKTFNGATDQAFMAGLSKAFNTPTKTFYGQPWKDEGYFCPGVLQREYIVAGQNYALMGRPISHIATVFVSSCLTIVAHAPGVSPVTGLLHLDENTDIDRSLDLMFAQFTSPPKTVQIVSRDFRDGLMQMISNWPGGPEKARMAIEDLWNARLNRVQEVAASLYQRGITLESVSLESPHTTFIADVKSGRIWSGEEPEGSIWYCGDAQRTLEEFYAAGKNRVIGPAANPYDGVIDWPDRKDDLPFNFV